MIVLTKETDVVGVLNNSRAYILKQGNMNSVSIFRFRPSSYTHYGHTFKAGYVDRDSYQFEEQDRVITMYPFYDRSSEGIARDVVRGMGFTNVDFKAPMARSTMTDKDFFALVRGLGCHNFHVVDGMVMVAVKGITQPTGKYDVVFKDIMELGASRALYCEVIKATLKSHKTTLPFVQFYK
jgi:hypothetical protein